MISKLINEGFNPNTLVKMSDKQIKLLSDRILSEQTAPDAKGKVFVKKNELNTINQLTKAGNDVIATEGEMQEQRPKSQMIGLGGKTLMEILSGLLDSRSFDLYKDQSEKHKVPFSSKMFVYDIESIKPYEKGIVVNFLITNRERQNAFLSYYRSKKPSFILSGSNIPSIAVYNNDILKMLNTFFESVNQHQNGLREELEMDNNYTDPETMAKSNANRSYSSDGQAILDAIEYVGGKDVWDSLSGIEQSEVFNDIVREHGRSMNESKQEIKAWIRGLVESNYSAYTTKKDITEMVNKKLNKKQDETPDKEDDDTKPNRKKEKLILGQKNECNKK